MHSSLLFGSARDSARPRRKFEYVRATLDALWFVYSNHSFLVSFHARLLRVFYALKKNWRYGNKLPSFDTNVFFKRSTMLCFALVRVEGSTNWLKRAVIGNKIENWVYSSFSTFPLHWITTLLNSNTATYHRLFSSLFLIMVELFNKRGKKYKNARSKLYDIEMMLIKSCSDAPQSL